MDGRRIVQQALDAQRVRDSHWMGPGLSVQQAIAASNAVSSEGMFPGSAQGWEIVRQAFEAQRVRDSHGTGSEQAKSPKYIAALSPFSGRYTIDTATPRFPVSGQATPSPRSCEECAVALPDVQRLLASCNRWYPTVILECTRSSSGGCSCTVTCSDRGEFCNTEECLSQSSRQSVSVDCPGATGAPAEPDEQPEVSVSESFGTDIDVDTDERPCTVIVGATRVLQHGVNAYWHTYVQFLSQDYFSRTYSGYPDLSTPAKCDFIVTNVKNYGYLKIHTGSRIPSAETPSVIVASTPQTCAVRECLEQEAERINTYPTCYGKFGPNSNSAAYTLLANCGLPVEKPDVWAPGWGELV